MTAIQRFNAKWMPEPNSGCWLWTASCYPTGYGAFYIGKSEKHNKIIPAHRASWIIHNGEIPDGLFVLHKCDVKSCVNPVHLFLGTKWDNTHDCINKGRFVNMGRPGEKNGRAKISEQEMLEIRSSKLPPKILAEKFGILPCAIWKIRTKMSWNHIK
jgi:hypothetical protein